MPVVARCLAQLIQLAFEVSDLVSLHLYFGLTLFRNFLEELVTGKLILHLSLSTTSLATSLEQVYSSTLGGYGTSSKQVRLHLE